MEYLLWTDAPATAAAAAAVGVSRIGPDLEFVGKEERQQHRPGLLSRHDICCLPRIRAAIGASRLFVRCNPVNPGLGAELARCVDEGVTSVMLPMVRSVGDVREALRLLRGRATLTVMIEHADALPLMTEIAAIDGVDAFYLGAHDLALSLNLPSRFDVLAGDYAQRLSHIAARHARGFSFYGLARMDDTALPVAADLTCAALVHLGASFALFARSFHAEAATLAAGVAMLNDRVTFWQAQPPKELAAAFARFRATCAAVAQRYR